jgi:hypothetical protein
VLDPIAGTCVHDDDGDQQQMTTIPRLAYGTAILLSSVSIDTPQSSTKLE